MKKYAPLRKATASRRAQKGKRKRQWTGRDYYCLSWIGEQRAIRYDQLQRLLARESDLETVVPGWLSESRTNHLIDRWEQAGLVIYVKPYVRRPGWLWLTRRGLRFAELKYRYNAPSESTFTHLYYINQARLQLEEEYDDDEMEWISERTILAEQKRRQKDQRLKHIPDAIIIFDPEGTAEKLDLEIELSRKSEAKLYEILRGGDDALDEIHPVRYYVSQKARAGVMKAYHSVMNTNDTFRAFIDIHDLKELEE